MNQKTAEEVIESLRMGIPSKREIESYSVGNEKLIEGIKKEHLHSIMNGGKTRFVNGSWGSGKTHFFGELQEISYKNECLVSNVQLDIKAAALNKFESIFAAIIRQISTPSYYYSGETIPLATPFSTVLHESLEWLSNGKRDTTGNL